jgi:hypothetical protein
MSRLWWAMESGRFAGQSRLRGRPGGERPVAIDPHNGHPPRAYCGAAVRHLLATLAKFRDGSDTFDLRLAARVLDGSYWRDPVIGTTR